MRAVVNRDAPGEWRVTLWNNEDGSKVFSFVVSTWARAFTIAFNAAWCKG